MNLPTEFPYNPKWRTMTAIAIFFGLCGAVLMSMAFRPRHALAEELFFGSLAALSSLLVIFAIALMARRLFVPKALRAEEAALVLPHGFFQRHTTRIPYVEIEHLGQVQLGGNQFLEMIWRGRKYTLTSALLPSLGSFEEIKAIIVAKCLPTGMNWRG